MDNEKSNKKTKKIAKKSFFFGKILDRNK